MRKTRQRNRVGCPLAPSRVSPSARVWGGHAGGSGEERAPALRVMASVELLDAQSPATTEWRLFQHVRQQIREAEQKVPGLNLREMACYVDDGGTLAKPFDLSWLRRDVQYIYFQFDRRGICECGTR